VVIAVAFGLAVLLTAGAPERRQTAAQSHHPPVGPAPGPTGTGTGKVRPTLPGPGLGHSPSPSTGTGTRTASCPSSTGKATLTVGSGGQYGTIQAAVNAASAGDTIEIAGGTYRESVDVNKSGSAGAYITLRAKAGQTVTLAGGNGLPASGSSNRGLLTLDNSRYVKIDGLTITGSHQHGIYAGQASDLVIQNTTVTGSQDGGILVGDGSGITIACDRIGGNNAAAAGGDIGAAANEAVTLFNVSNFSVTGNSVFGNHEEGIDVKDGTHDGTIRGNQVYQNNGPNIYVDGASNVQISANHVYSAKGSSKSGIGLAVESGGSASNVDIFSNVIYSNPGGGVDFWIGTYSDVQIYSNRIYNNGQAAIRVSGGTVTGSGARNNIVYGNPLNSVSGFTMSGNVTTNPD
jgi:parallel beta-helix repeat protein